LLYFVKQKTQAKKNACEKTGGRMKIETKEKLAGLLGQALPILSGVLLAFLGWVFVVLVFCI